MVQIQSSKEDFLDLNEKATSAAVAEPVNPQRLFYVTVPKSAVEGSTMTCETPSGQLVEVDFMISSVFEACLNCCISVGHYSPWS